MCQRRTNCELLSNVLENDTRWNWSAEFQKAVEVIKKQLKSELTLTHYDTPRRIILASDTSEYGIGAVIGHSFEDGTVKPAVCASRNLANTEKFYSQIEKEALAISFTLKKCHVMPLGRKFILHYHCSLLSIFGSKKWIPTHTIDSNVGLRFY